MIESSLTSEGQQKAFIDIDETICFYEDKRIYDRAIPDYKNIFKINKLKKEGWHITYYTARGGASKVDYYQFTKNQLDDWGCCLLYTSPSPRDRQRSRMPSSA